MRRKAQLRDLFNQQAGKCAYCKEDMTLELGWSNTATRDHIIPKSKFKISDKFNLVAACNRCNMIKSDRPLAEFIGLMAKWTKN